MRVDVTLNIHYTAPKALWARLWELYTEMPGWRTPCPEEYSPCWFGPEGGGKGLAASVEPGGLQISGEMPEEEWSQWLALFKERAGEIMGYAIGEPAEGFDFRYYSE